MNVYLDASAQVRVLKDDGPGLGDWDRWEQTFSSQIARVETRRALDRVRLAGSVNDRWTAGARKRLFEIERRIIWLPISPMIIGRASEPMSVVVGALDAIHLASAAAIRSFAVPGLVFATHDRQQAIGALALGFEVIGVTI